MVVNARPDGRDHDLLEEPRRSARYICVRWRQQQGHGILLSGGRVGRVSITRLFIFESLVVPRAREVSKQANPRDPDRSNEGSIRVQ